MKRRMDRWHDRNRFNYRKRLGHNHFLNSSSASDDFSGNLDQQIKSLKSQINDFGFGTSYSNRNSKNSSRSVTSERPRSKKSATGNGRDSNFYEPEEHAFSSYRSALQDLDSSSGSASRRSVSSTPKRSKRSTNRQEVARLSEAATLSQSSSTSSTGSKSGSFSRSSSANVSSIKNWEKRGRSTVQSIKKHFRRRKRRTHRSHHRKPRWTYYDRHQLTWYLVAIIVIVLICGGVLYYQQDQDRKIIEKTYDNRERIENDKSSLAPGIASSDSGRARTLLWNVYGRVNNLVDSTDPTFKAPNQPGLATYFVGGTLNPSFEHLTSRCRQLNRLNVKSVTIRTGAFKHQGHHFLVNYTVRLKYLTRQGPDTNRVHEKLTTVQAVLKSRHKHFTVAKINDLVSMPVRSLGTVSRS